MPKILNYELQCMRDSLFILLFIGLLSCSNRKNNVERIQKTPPQESFIQPKKTDEQQQILTMKPYKTLEDDILILKNVALCNFIMKCIDFYNSKTLEKHIDSLKQLTTND